MEGSFQIPLLNSRFQILKLKKVCFKVIIKAFYYCCKRVTSLLCQLKAHWKHLAQIQVRHSLKLKSPVPAPSSFGNLKLPSTERRKAVELCDHFTSALLVSNVLAANLNNDIISTDFYWGLLNHGVLLNFKANQGMSKLVNYTSENRHSIALP